MKRRLHFVSLFLGGLLLQTACSGLTITSQPPPSLTAAPTATLQPSRTPTPDLPATQDAERFRLTVQAFQTETAAERATELAEAAGGDGVRLENIAELQTGTIFAVDFSEDRRRAVVLVDGRTLIVSTDDLSLLADLEGEAFNHVAFQPSGEGFTAGFLDGSLLLFPDFGEPAIYLDGYARPSGPVYSADGALVLGGTAEGQLRIWEAGSGLEVASIEVSAAFGVDDSSFEILISPEGESAALFFVNASSVWIGSTASLLAGEPEGVLVPWLDHAGPVASVLIDPDWTRLVWVSRATLQLMAIDGTRIGDPLQHEDWVANLAFAPQQDLLLFSSLRAGPDAAAGLLRAIDLTDGALRIDDETPEVITSLAVRPDGLSAATAHADGSIWIWDLVNGSRMSDLAAHSGPVQQLVYSPDGSFLASFGSSEQGPGFLELWDAGSGLLQATLSLPQAVFHWIGFNQDGSALIVAAETGWLQLFAID